MPKTRFQTLQEEVLRERAEAAQALVADLGTDKPAITLSGPHAVDALFDWLNAGSE